MIIRGIHKHSYTIVPNEIFTHGMSKGACGILAYLIGKHEDWKVSAANLAKVFSCGKDAILSDLRELERFGYAQRRIGGKSAGFDWIIADSPITGKPDNRETRKSTFPALQSKEEETSKDKEQSKELSRPTACPVPPSLDRFSDFWQAYPRKIAKTVAQRAWTKLKLDSLAEFILADITRRRLDDPSWSEIQYIPHPATYLNQRRWEDEIDTRAGRSPKKRVNSCGYSNWI